MSQQIAILAEHGLDAGVPWHYGDPMREQRGFAEGAAVVDLSHRGVLTVTGPYRLTWLHSFNTQHLSDLPAGVGVTTLVLSPQGHIEHVLYGVDDGTTFWAHTEPGAAPALVAWLMRMRFLMRVEVADRTDEIAVVWQLGATSAPLPEPVASLAEPVEGAAPWLRRSGPDSLGGGE